MKHLILIFLLATNGLQAQEINPFSNSNKAVNDSIIKAYPYNYCDYKTIYLGAINYLPVPYEYFDKAGISIKVSHGSLLSSLDEHQVFKWQVCDTTIDTAFLFVYQNEKLEKKISYFLNKNKYVYEANFFHPNCFKTHFQITDSIMYVEINERSANCSISRFMPEYYSTHIKLLRFDILVLNRDETEDSIFISNQGNIIHKEFFQFYKNYESKHLSNKVVFGNFKVYNECLNEEYYLKKNFSISMFR